MDISDKLFRIAGKCVECIALGNPDILINNISEQAGAELGQVCLIDDKPYTPRGWGGGLGGQNTFGHLID